MMNYGEFSEKLKIAFNENGLGNLLNSFSSKKLYDFADILIKTNSRMNLTAITDENGIILKHFVDCASISKYIPLNSSMIDIGCGAGFPSLPISILREDVRVVAIDSTNKKIDFIDLVSKELDIKNIYPKCVRAEDFAKEARESFDIATSRAVAKLSVLDELCLPFVKVGGSFIAMKSSKGGEEHREAESGLKILGGKLNHKEVLTLSFCGDSIEREIFVFEKDKSTPSAYPRNYSQISKKPL